VKRKGKTRKLKDILQKVFVQKNNNVFGYFGKKTAASAAIFFLCGCNNLPQQTPIQKTFADNLQAKRIADYKKNIYPKLLNSIKSGDIIARMGTDFTSFLIAQTNQNLKDYSHCGVVLLENDSFFVYHAIGGAWNPDQKIKREPLYVFAFPTHAKKAGIFSAHVDKAVLQMFSEKIRDWYNQGILFDMDFDWESQEKMYCTEMVAKGLILASGDDQWLPKVIHKDKTYILLENLLNNEMIEAKRSMAY
jgi:hypothetical protein